MNERFVLFINDEEKNEIWEARFAVREYHDKLKTSLVHHSDKIRQNCVKMQIGVATIFGFRIFSTDVTKAFLRSAGTLMRDISLKPPFDLWLKPNQLLHLLKPLHGLSGSGDYWRFFLATLAGEQNTRPDIAFSIPTLGKVMGASFLKELKEYLRSALKLLKHLNAKEDLSLQFSNLVVDFLCL